MIENTAVLRRILGAFAILLLLAGCGGGGGGGGGDGSSNGRHSISLSTGSLSFSGVQYTTIPAQTVTATFKGDGVAVGTLPGQVPVSWLQVLSTGTSGNQATFSVQVTPGGLPVGTHTSTLRFLSGAADGSSVVHRDLTVTLNLREGFKATAAADMRFTATEAGPYTPADGVNIQITGENVAWSIEDPPAWLQFSATSGNARGSINVRPNMTGLAAGYYQQIFRIRDSVSGGSWGMFASVQVNEPQLTLSSTQFDILLNAQTPLSALQYNLAVSDTALGQNIPKAISWGASSNSPLLTVTPTTGSTAGAPTTLTVDLDRDQLNALRSGAYLPTATINTYTYLRFNLDVRLPRANTIDPYFVTAGTPATVTLLGENLIQEDLALLRMNGQPLSALGASATLTNEREISLTLPALAANDYEVSFHNELGLSRSAAALKVVVAQPTPGAGDIVTTGNRVKLLFDPTRTRLYGVDVLHDEIERYQWNGTQWVTLSSVSIPRLADAALLRDGRHLVASTTALLWKVDLDSGVATTMSATADPTCINTRGHTVAAPATGSLFADARVGCTTSSDVKELDLLSNVLADPLAPETSYMDWLFDTSTLATSGNGRVLAIGSTRTSGGHYGLFDVINRTFIDRGDSFRYNYYYYYRLDLDRTGTRVLINNYTVRDRTGADIGQLPANEAATLSADGTRAYAYIHGAGGTGHVAIFDITTPVGALNVFPQVGADIAVPSDMGAPDTTSLNFPTGYDSFGMTLSPDEQLLFIGGSARIVAIDLP
ncbi:hypothetical protein GCM10011487_52090 [Steroidobacter agaridevorans]|uniref:BACON domain-containing protein n=1 Tax=Steroidobacter agaridevorans TaxID=2695856 RepID=A0A829YJ54_9GAMM|nr:hypothetical protein [Steroidobacter agaridevorans]GFE83209.1 hypothetical protein GCM10011487_52090 [Steroidobacter agaridevorans]